MSQMNSGPAGMEELKSCLAQYREFLDQMVEEQNEKLAVLLTHDLEAIEGNVAKQQALSLQMKNREEARLRLQQRAGFGEMTMEEIAGTLEGEDKQWFAECLAGMRRSIEQIKYLNGKAMQLVETDLAMIRLAQPEDPSGVQGYTEKGRQTAPDQDLLLDSKI